MPTDALLLTHLSITLVAIVLMLLWVETIEADVDETRCAVLLIDGKWRIEACSFTGATNETLNLANMANVKVEKNWFT